MRFISASFTRSSSFFSRVSASVSGGLVSSSFIVTTTKDLGGFTADFTDGKVVFTVPSQSAGGSADVKALVISASGDNPKIGVGTQDPKSTLDIKDVEDSSLGTKFLLQSARTDTLGAQVGDGAGSIFFSIDSGSYNDPFTTGSVASISSKVTSREDTANGANVADNILINSSPEWIETLLNVAEMGFFPRHGVIPPGEDSSAGMYISGALIVGGENSSQGDLRPFEVFGRDNSDGTNPGARYLQLSQESNTFTLYSSSLQVGSGSIFIGETYSGNNSVEFVNLRGSNSIKLGHISGGGGNHPLEIYTANGQLAAKFDNSQNLGIGTSANTAPEKLTVEGNISSSGDITSNTFETISTTLASDAITNVDTFATSTYNGAIYDYILKDSTVGARAGQFMVAHDDGDVTFTDTSTKHLSDSTIPEITADISGGDTVRVRITNGNGYTFKSFVKKL